MSLSGQVAWVVGGVGVVGRGIARGLLQAGATVICHSRSEERLERIRHDLQDPPRLVLVHGSLLPDQGDPSVTVRKALQAVAEQDSASIASSPPKLHHVVSHGAVRYWTQKRAGCDETYQLTLPLEHDDNHNCTGPPFFWNKLSPQEFRQQSSQLVSLHYSAVSHLMPLVQHSYTFVTGDGSGHPSTQRSPLGEINSHHIWGLSAAVRHACQEQQQQQQQDSSLVPLCREIRIGIPYNRPLQERQAHPRERPLSEDIGDLCAGLAASSNNKEQGKFIRIDTMDGLHDWLVHYQADKDKDLEPLPSFAEFVGSL